MANVVVKNHRVQLVAAVVAAVVVVVHVNRAANVVDLRGPHVVHGVELMVVVRVDSRV